MRKLVWMVSMVGLAAAVACGGGKKSADEPKNEDLRTVEEEPDEATLIPEETYEEIKNFFLRKARIVGKCFPEAIQSGEVGKNDKGFMTVELTITKEGKPTKVRIGKNSFKSKNLEGCLIKYVERWSFPTLPKPLPYSHTFVFQSM